MIHKTSCELEDCRWILGVSEDLILLLRMSQSDGETETEVHMFQYFCPNLYISYKEQWCFQNLPAEVVLQGDVSLFPEI